MQNIHTIREVLYQSKEKYRTNVAFTIKTQMAPETVYRDITYDEFFEEIRALATAFLEKGLKRIAVIGKNGYNWALAYYASVAAGIVSIPLDRGLPKEEIESCVERSGAEMVIYDSSFNDIIDEISKNDTFKDVEFLPMRDRKLLNGSAAQNDAGVSQKGGIKKGIRQKLSLLGKKKKLTSAEEDGRAKVIGGRVSASMRGYVAVGRRLLESGNTLFDEVKVSGDELAAILFTSGTTANSKAVMLTNDNIVSNIYALNVHLDLRKDDVNMAFLPLHHTFGNTGLLLMLSNGARTVFCDGLKYIQKNLAEYKVSVFIAVPLLIEGIYQKIIKEAKKQGKYKSFLAAMAFAETMQKMKIDVRRKLFKSVHQKFGGNLRIIVSGASALSKDAAKGFNLMGIDLIQGYGLTETSPVVSGEKVGHPKYGSVGVPMCNLQVKIADKDKNGIGEIIVKGPSVMKGYYNDPEETAKVLKDGWFYTGDIGYQDASGHFYIKGRKKNVIVLKNGKNIYPEELEEKLTKLPYIAEALVYGEEKGEDLVVSAKIVYDEGELIKTHSSLQNASEIATKEGLELAIRSDVDRINSQMPVYKHIKRISITDVPMEKTTTAKVKRHKELNK